MASLVFLFCQKTKIVLFFASRISLNLYLEKGKRKKMENWKTGIMKFKDAFVAILWCFFSGLAKKMFLIEIK
jgi:hypothetical protein